jgi:hypothetical protein
MSGYSIEDQKILKLCKLEFKDTFSMLTLNLNSNEISIGQRVKTIDEVIAILEGAAGKGFLTTVDLRLYPILSEIVPLFLQGESDNENLKYVNGEGSMESYK